MTIRAAQAGKHVMTEKIMARNLDEAEQMIRATDEAGVIFMVAFVLRYRREFMIMHEICSSGQLGQIHQAYVQTAMMLGGVAQWRTTVEMFPMGALMSHGCHYVDQLIWNVGEIVETTCMGNAFTFAEEIPGGDDTEVMINRHENGAVSAYCESWATPYPMTRLKLDVYGKEGTARVEYLPDARRVVEVNDADGWERVWEYDPNKAELMDVFGGAKDMHGQIAHFIECILDGKQPLTHGREGIKPMQAIAAATEGQKRGEIINVQEWLKER
jgi:UDP-N-acetylglucosamine 3-dehydrogenase